MKILNFFYNILKKLQVSDLEFEILKNIYKSQIETGVQDFEKFTSVSVLWRSGDILHTDKSVHVL